MKQKTEASQAVDEPVLPHLPRAVGYRHTMDNTEGLKGNKPVAVFCVTKPNPFGIPGLDYSASFPVTTETLFTADQMKAYARAALKAQPAPTEAQGEPVAWMHDGVGRFEAVSTEVKALWKKVRPRHVEHYTIPLYRHPTPTKTAQGESPFKFRPWSKEAAMVEGWAAAEKARDQAQGDRHALQAEGKHPAPCARHCEATAFGIEIRRLTAENAQLRAAQGEDSARLDAEVKRLRSVIDTALEGWNMSFELRKMLETALWPASAETGGVKP